MTDNLFALSSTVDGTDKREACTRQARASRCITINEIVAHPDYERFAAAMTRAGKQIDTDAFPWCHMGKADAEILEDCDRFISGEEAPMEKRLEWIEVIRHHEQRVILWWNEWVGAC